MIKLTSVFVVWLYISCAPAVRMQDRSAYYPEQNALFNSEGELSDSDQIENNMGSYLKGYNDGMITAKNVPLGGCMVGGCFIGGTGVLAGLYAPAIFGPDSYDNLTVVILSLVGGITTSVGSVYLANRIAKVSVPDPMVEDTLYRKGFTEGYRVSFKSRRMSESLKGMAIGVGTTCAGYAVFTVLVIYLLFHLFFME